MLVVAVEVLLLDQHLPWQPQPSTFNPQAELARRVAPSQMPDIDVQQYTPDAPPSYEHAMLGLGLSQI